MEADDAEGGFVEFDVFFVIGVGSVVCGDDVEGAVEEAGDESLAVFFGA